MIINSLAVGWIFQSFRHVQAILQVLGGADAERKKEKCFLQHYRHHFCRYEGLKKEN
jgi:hypothetical protein